jgi:peroxiredoxin
MPNLNETQQIIVGQTAPDFSLPDTTGTLRQLSELTRDSSCVVLFYRGHW